MFGKFVFSKEKGDSFTFMKWLIYFVMLNIVFGYFFISGTSFAAATDEDEVTICHMTENGIDNDLDGFIDCLVCDGDRDGFLSFICGGGDCNDSDFNINPGVTEICDGLDNDCDGEVDEGCQVYPASGNVVINELMWMGSDGDSRDEWIEFRNTTSADISLDGCSLYKKGDTSIVDLSPYTLLADNYLLVSYRNQEDSKIDFITNDILPNYFLHNTELEITLKCDNVVIDTANNGGLPFEGENGDLKKSMQRKANPADGTASSSWCTASTQVNWDASSTDMGTPGAANDCEGDIPEIKGSITIIKDTGDFQTDISFEFSGDWEFSLRSGSSTIFSNLGLGIYEIYEENLPDNWYLADINCGEASTTPVEDFADGVFVDLSKGEDVVCTFINAYQEPILDESICGYKYNHITGDPITTGWTIYLKQECSAGEEWADEVISPIEDGDSNRKVRDNALNEAQDSDINTGEINFYSLGMGGEMILRFDNTIWNETGPDIEVFETTYGSPDCVAYPEYVQVFASQDGTEWTQLGDRQCQDDTLQFDLGVLPWATYVKLVDMSEVEDGDGFDVDGVRALHCWAAIEETTTDPDGYYCFSDLEDGEYRVEEDISDPEWNYFEYYYYPVNHDNLLLENPNLKINFRNYPSSYCGDGDIDEGEDCDDGNNEDGDGCNSSCQLETSAMITCVYIDDDGLASTTENRVLATSSTWSFILEGELSSSTIDIVDGCLVVDIAPGEYHLEGNQSPDWLVVHPLGDFYDFTAVYGATSSFEFAYYDDSKDDEWCGDGECNNGETCSTCPEDCGSCGGGSHSSSGGRAYIFFSEPVVVEEEEPIVLGEVGAPFLEISIDPELVRANPGDENVKFSITVLV